MVASAVEGIKTPNPSSSALSRPESSLSLQTPNSRSILQTALAGVKGELGGSTARLYFDTGGSRSFISTTTARKIGATFVGEESVSVGRFRDSKRSTITYRIYEFQISFLDGTRKTVRMSSEKIISCPIQLIPLNPQNCPILASVKLAEPLVTKPTMVSIDILIGTDYYYEFVGDEQIRCSSGIVLISSPFGYIVGGCLKSASGNRSFESSLLIHQHRSTCDVPSLERFWSLEDIGIKEDFSKHDDEAAVEMFSDTIQFKKDRYFVKWPWKGKYPDFPDNYALSLGQLKSLYRRLQPDNQLAEAYNKTFCEQREKGIIEEAPLNPQGPVHYIPHHGVLSPSKATTKLRIVYDASAKTANDSLSLNDCLHRGPVLLPDSVGIIMRFRLHRIALISDIEKAFLQVGLQEADRDATRFLWMKDPGRPVSADNIVTYRFCRVPFGVISSPFLLSGTIAHHLGTINTPVAKSILRNVYVDNAFGGTETHSEALNYYSEAKSLFESASMNLREWFSNSSSFIDKLQLADRGKGSSTSVLGIKWDLMNDTFHVSFKCSSEIPVNCTKRYILHTIASIFDPCGLFAPVSITGKLLMQRLWTEKVDWDTVVPEDVKKIFTALISDLKKLPQYPIPRQLSRSVFSDNASVDLHCFCDASTKAYSAVVYIRITTENGRSSDLIYAKSRVAPIKHISVPRLELMAVVIGTRVLKFVESQLHIEIASRTLWTDSSCVLSWIAHKKVTTVFVQNRIREIHSHPSVDFRFVMTSENPADLPSRGVNFETIQSSELWWHGPPWLLEANERWPNHPNTWQRKESRLETPAAESCFPSHSVLNATPLPLLDLERFSSLQRLYRVTSYVCRFISAVKKQQKPCDLIVDAHEIGAAKQLWDRNVQLQSFPTLITGNPSKVEVSLKRNLGVFLDSSVFLRCRGRYLKNTSTGEMDYPILLPKNHYYTDLIIKDSHNRLLHSGVRHTLSETRREYWIVHGRNQVRRVLKRCRLCRYYDGGPFRTPCPPSLPDFRISCQRPFETTGIDYLGPMLIQSDEGDTLTKVWVCLYTCATVRAVHLEAVRGLTTTEFLLCFRRFVALFGRPKLVICDNAKHFHTAEKVLARLWQDVLHDESIQSFSAKEGISWKFITELSPWMGGFYERMIGLIKASLKKTIHHRCLSLIELQTLLAEIASVVNSRPLLCDEESVEGNSLTPSHFLQKSAEGFPISRSEQEYLPNPTSRDKLMTTWKRMQALLLVFWKSWSTSYLQSLQDYVWKPKNRNTSPFTPTVGTVVLIKDTTQRQSWRLGTIIDLIHSFDNICRSAIVRLPSGAVLRRPLRLIYPLEYHEESSNTTSETGPATAKLVQRPSRQAATIARYKIKRVLQDSNSEPDDH